MFVLIHRHLPDCDGVTKYSAGFNTHETQEDADKAVRSLCRQNLPFSTRSVEIANPWKDAD